MWSFLASLFTGGLSALLGTVGKTITDIHADNTTRYKNEGDAGNQLAGTIANSSDRAAATRADVQKSQGAWGPFGLAGFIIAMMFAYHVSMIVLDSTPWHISLTTVAYIIPWLKWVPHHVGSWGIAILPGKFEETEHAIL